MKKRLRINTQITARRLRVIDKNEKQIGILSREDALERAKGASLDLVEVAPEANPPVARILDFKKYIYQKRRKEQKTSKKRKGGEVKEIRFGPNISPNDLRTKIERARIFLSEGGKVKLTVHFKGRQVTHPEIGQEKLEIILKELAEVGTIELEPKKEGYFLYAILKPA